jgi:hypothetical protein
MGVGRRARSMNVDLGESAGKGGRPGATDPARPAPPELGALNLVLIALTAAALGITRVWDPSVLGQGAEEFSRLLRALVTVAVVVGLVGLALKLPEVRPYVFSVIPVAFILAAITRLALRTALHRRRREGACLHEVLVVGTEDDVTELIMRTRRAPRNGWVVTGACTPSGAGTDGGRTIHDVPVVGDLDSVPKVARLGAAGHTGPDGWGTPFPLRLYLLGIRWGRWRRAGRRGRPATARHALRRVQGAGRGRVLRAG